MKNLNNFFHETLQEYYSNGLCCYCNKEPWTELAHNESNSKANKKILGEMVNAPLIQTLPSCHKCNMEYRRTPQHVPIEVVIAGRNALSRYANYKYVNKIKL